MTEIDWPALHAAALTAAAHAYAPYSRFHVGAAALTTDGRLITGCNVENASYGLTLCAECGLISTLHNSGGGTLAAFVCVNAAGEIISPCGRCRQLLAEHSTPDTLFAVAQRTPVTIEELLPGAFGPGALID